ncbi:filamentous hemagglutinin family protein [Azonexus sp. IMCC34842]|uniref:filamentous haemagglutinin family protein n=1 Tax=Azonexus sp. IMCC34842 TaxID=3420950 RepID=UPI003D0E997E
MNRNIFRLVFNAERHAWVPVAENVRGRGKKNSRRRLAGAALGLALAGVGNAQAAPAVPAANAVPVPSSGARPFVFSGSVLGGQPSTAMVGGTNTMTINTPSRTLGLNWDSFNIGSDAAVVFNQPDATSRVLNRIWSADPSVIMGRLTANGEVYLINQNGILFGNGSQVNVGGLVASALNLSEGMLNKLLNSGLPTTRGDRLEFAWDGTAAAFNLGFITVDAGARIGTPSGGRVVLLAPKTVENLGLIEGGAGAEAILAAGGKVVLTVPDDPSLRGLLVETQAFAGKDVSGNAVSLDGSVTNTGRINAGSGGVVSLAALAVNQKGIVNASRAVNLNGTTMLVSGSIETDRLTINQRGPKAEIDWVSGFNVGAGKTVEFVQPSTGSVVYNYVYDPDRMAADGSILNVAGRSSIDGILRATGQFFLINERGIRFGANADVRAANFVASALGVSPTLVRNGIFAMDYVDSSMGGTRSFYLSKNQFAADAEGDYAGVSASARAAFAAATVDVENGAKISTSIDNGFVMLIGGTVNQGGTISSPTGQTLLAAGADVYLKPPFSAGLRGFMAEVNPLYVVRKWDSNAWGVIEHGTVNNWGSIAAALGNISLVGYNINQLGNLWTSTSVTSNGSISLVARDQVAGSGLANDSGEIKSEHLSKGQRNFDSEGVAAYVDGESYKPDEKAKQPVFIVGMKGGNLFFGASSVTEVALDGSSKKTIAAEQSFISSSIDSIAKQIIIAGNGRDGAQLTAHGGQIRFLASDTFDLTRGFIRDPLSPQQGVTPTAGVGIFVGDGAKLDVSGVTAAKSVSDLFVEVELRGDEFANNAVQRYSKLRGKKAWVDIRDAVKVADLSGWFGKVGQTVEERAATGGTISLRTTGSVIVKGNAELNVSGGGVAYQGGKVTESRLFSVGGKSYRVNDAPASAIYYGIKDRQRKLADYYEGRSAGTVDLRGHSLAVDGKLIANTTRGTKQRTIGDPTKDHYAVPLGGRLIVQDAGQHFPLADRDNATEEERIRAYSEAQVAFVKGAANAATGLAAGDSAGPRLELSQSLVDAGFSRFDLKSDGRIEVGSQIELDLAPGGTFSAFGRQVYIAGKISAPNGNISLKTRDMSTAVGLFPTLFDAKYSTLIVDNGGSLSTAGQWVNDYLDRKENSRKVKATDGGTISLTSAYDIDLRAGSELNVSGGALVNSKGKIEAGDAGSIVLTTGGMARGGGFNFTEDADRRDASLFLDGALSAYALGSGGSLEINTSAVQIGKHFATASRNWSRATRLAENQVGVALTTDFFNNGGFYDFKLVGRDGVAVLDGTHLAAQPINWSLQGLPGYRRKASGTSLASFARSVVFHPEQRSSATDLTLATRSLNYGDLVVGENTYLGVSPQGSINLESAAQLTVLGTLEAPAGSIKLSRPANPASDLYNVVESFAYTEAKQSESIYLGPNSQLLAAGTTVLSAATRRALAAGNSADSLRERRRYKGELLSGGKVDIDAGMGYLITAQGSTIDVSGTQDSLNAPSTTSNGGLSYATKTLGSAGGQIALAAQEGMFLDGTYKAEGKNGAPGGIFSLSLYKRPSSESWYATNEANLPATIKDSRLLSLHQSSGARPLQWQLNADQTAAYLNGERVLASGDYNGKATLDIASLTSAGFGSWYLNSQDQIDFSGNIAATVNNQLRLNAPKFSAADDTTRVSLTAAAIQLGNYAPAAAPVTTAATGLAEATFTARDIGISGNFTWNDFAVTRFTSSGEIHFDSTVNSAANRIGGRNLSGQMTGSGAVVFSAARLSPSTYSDYRVDLTSDAGSSIEINRAPGSSAAPSLAAAGRIEFAAQDILHSGTVTAPLGEIVFNAPGGSVMLSENSVTSVAAGQTMLFGQTDQSGRYWQFKSAYWNPQTKEVVSEIYKVEKAPEKAIRIDAADSIVMARAQLDLSGGGEAIASEFTAGPGGKTDILAASVSAGMTTFSVLPGWNGAVAPQDSQAMGYYNVSSPTALVGSDGKVSYKYSPIATLKAGDQIQLAANGSGLAAGTYTLLPATYAQLPGAYLVSVKSTSDRIVSRSRGMTDGGWLVNGSIMASNADGSSSAYSQSAMTFEVANPSVVGARAKYQISKLSEFFYDTAGNSLPGDAGQLSVIGRHSVSFDPTIVAMRQAEIAAADGRKRAGEGLKLDLAAPKLLISDGSAASDASWSVIDQNKLVALGAASLLLGGVRDVQGETTNIETIASHVLVQNGGVANAKNALIGPELMLTAKKQVTVTAGSRIESFGKVAGRKVVLKGYKPPPEFAPLLDPGALLGYGAFLRVAEGGQSSLVREGIVKDLDLVDIPQTGDLVLATGATIAGQALIFDATHSNTQSSTFALGKLQADGSRSGGYLSIGAGRINVVADGSTPAEGLTFGNDDFARFAKADQLRLASYSTLDLYGDAMLGSASLNELVLAAAGIAGHGGESARASIVAKQIVFENPSSDSTVFTTTGLGGGTLDVSAEQITFGNNRTTQAQRDAGETGFALRGFDNVNLRASADVRFAGRGVTAVDNDSSFGGSGTATRLVVDAGRVTTVGTADHLLTASGGTAIRGGVAGSSATGLGGTLELRGQSIDVSGRIETAAGKLTLAATGTGSSDDVTVRNTAVISAEGSQVAFADTYAYASGGEITLKSAKGNVRIDSGAVVSVSAHAEGGDAGSLALIAEEGTVSAGAGTLRGAAKAGDPDLVQGRLKVDALSLALDGLADAVRQLLPDGSTRTNFGGEWDIRARAGVAPQNLALSKTITAENVTIANDNGGITVGASGVIDASAAKGGKIGLYGRNDDVVLDGQLLAKGTEVVSDASNAGTRGQGGEITLATSGTGKVVTSAGSVIDVGVADDSVATGGKVNFRAAKSASITNAADLNVQLAGTIRGARDVGAEIVSSSSDTALTSAKLATIKNGLNTLYSAANMALLRSHLGFDSSIYHIRAGVEITSAGDFTISNDLDFSTLRFQGEAGVLTVRAAGNLNINGTLSDGFVANGSNTAVSRDAKLSSTGDAWSYRLVAGADAGAAAPLTTKIAGTEGSIKVDSTKLVRTGRGSIDMAASKDIKLLDRAAVYTAGIADSTNPANFSSFGSGSTINSIISVFPIGGGDISLTAGERLLMVSTGENDPVAHHINQWLFRAGGNIRDLQWWPRIASFQQGVAAFGGGDITLTAGSQIKNFTAYIPTSGRVPTVDGERQPELAVVTGGGDLIVRTPGEVKSGLYYAESGRLRIDAGTLSDNVGLALGNTSARIVADGDVQLGNVFNPLWVTAGKYVNSGGSSSISGSTADEYKIRIGTYGERSAVSVVSLAGNVDLNPDKRFFEVEDDQAHFVAPAKVFVAALNGDIYGALAQAPGTNGQLDLLAAGSIALDGDSIKQLDLPASVLPSVSNPVKGTNFSLLSLLGGAATTSHSVMPWHEGDNQPSRLVTLTGNISGPDDKAAVFSEAVQVESGGKIKDMSLTVQHLAEDSVSRVTAKGDISFTLDNTKTAQGFKVNGPGRLEVIAGGNVDLGTSTGIVSKGNVENPYLPTGGADLFVMAGTTSPDYAGFLKYLLDNGLSVGSDRTPNGLRNRFYSLLRDFGNEAEHGGGESSYEQGRAVIRALFPTASFSEGNIDLFYSAIKTEQSGRIDLLAPGGGVTVGIANPSSSIVRKPAEQGLFTFRGGDIRAFVRENFLVNQSRVFTLDGGDILVWADRGNIDAGNGAKTVSATPPPVLVVRDGQIILDASNSVSGSGIGALTSRDSSPISNMYLFAPQGAIDAGDAGLRSSGNITLGAQTILNASNIQAAGSVTGAPAPAVTAAPVATPTSPANSDKGEAQAASALAGNREAAPGILTVEVIEGGEAAAEPTAAPTSKKDDEKKKR